LSELIKAHPKATYGERMIREALNAGAVDRLLLSEGLRRRVAELSCASCNHAWTETVSRHESLPPCPSCDGNRVDEGESTSLIDEFVQLALKGNAEVLYISVDTEEGAQLLEGFGGTAALLRYAMM
jgi:peptide chain release factor subunit 1